MTVEYIVMVSFCVFGILFCLTFIAYTFIKYKIACIRKDALRHRADSASAKATEYVYYETDDTLTVDTSDQM